ETLVAEGLPGEALVEFDRLHDAGSLAPEHMLTAGRAALAAGRQDRAQAFVEAAAALGHVEGISELQNEINESLGLQGMVQVVHRGVVDDEGVLQPPQVELDSKPAVTFADVGGLDDVKKTIQRTIILPFQRH